MSEYKPIGWPRNSNETLEWLVNGTSRERFIDDIFTELCERLRSAGTPVARATLFLNTYNPQWQGARILWRIGDSKAAIITFDYGIEDTGRYQNSPIRELDEGADVVRRRISENRGQAPWYPVYDELLEEGLTDYLALGVEHTLGKRQSVTFASDGAGGFSEADIQLLKDILPALALVSEIRLKNRLARTLLETYVGPHASEQILAGATRRGSGTTVRAAVLICDLRDFTSISDMWPRDDVIELLNSYFDAVSDPIEQKGGEILKFMGDGLLAIFPLSNPQACESLLAAVTEARANMSAMNDLHVQKGHPALRYGMGVHVGDVMYGNIGSRKRLDFTVIGPAVNIASRLEKLTKTIKKTVLLSADFVEAVGKDARMEGLGSFELRGVTKPIEVFTFG
ncbi:adenylate/guanylate cyclase domain-containing protein [Rhizobium leguminosarum bv. viciae]|jgi:adenylate cyclase|nr:adenylate/guanylate cyclase domain-containing protein [Rhizobium leguminosarum bv. viciae]